MNDTLPSPLRERLSARYAEPHRRYHTLEHIHTLLGGLRQHHHLARVPAEIEAAIWFHDAVYDTRRLDNEARSAELALDELQAIGWPLAQAERVAELVRATQHHRTSEQDTDAHLFLDLDLSVLATHADGYTAYARAIRGEFDWVEEDAYRTGRSRVLRAFLDREAIYRTPVLRSAWEAQARHNLEAELQALAALGQS